MAHAAPEPPQAPDPPELTAIDALLARQAGQALRHSFQLLGGDAARAAAVSAPELPVDPPDWAQAVADAAAEPTVVFGPLTDPAGRIVDFVDVAANTAARVLAPRSAPGLGQRLTVTQPTAVASGLFPAMRQVLVSGEPLTGRDWDATLMADGAPLHRRLRITATRYRGHVVVTFDDTARRHELISDRVQEQGLIGWGEWELASGHCDWSPGLYVIFDRGPGSAPLTLGELSRCLVPQDRTAFRVALEHVMSGLPVEQDLRLRLTGHVRHLRFALEPQRGVRGPVWGVQALVRDVSKSYLRRVQLNAAVDAAERSGQQADAEARVAARLREAVLPSHPPEITVQGVTSAVAYRPAETRPSIGGDWYNVQPLPDGRVLYALGDAAGHGLDAVARMASLRGGLAGLAHTGRPVEELTAWLNLITCDEGMDGTATAIVSRYHPDRELLRWVRAGHLPPVLLRDGRAHLLDEHRGLMLGVLPDVTYTASELALREGDTVLMCTDGLVERRDQDISEGLAALLSAAERYAELSPQQLVDRVSAELLPVPHEDDSCLLALRRGHAAVTGHAGGD
ncbi:PP2C family protein-serine/threonine phosphatase [Streptomyces sp. VRA16 Mangrove soil]|uniref:PP2C family protein-serine/threonine phosphatase n=1 Tax=Streptomyces sp. VRA16 Mangrove soil TaxID=2817434 RepID=UPI001A9DAB6E|nr:PP2C family protein-serine/threonine phosphatase [Streptomyces sp. VRA16 Mangrove soil]MBO1332174.1 serine/threonine-protein phosphatase [Streptomyces sp. VRA16 Mangrove soil]